MVIIVQELVNNRVGHNILTTLLLLLFTKELLQGSDLVTYHVVTIVNGNITLYEGSLGSGNNVLTQSFVIQNMVNTG